MPASDNTIDWTDLDDQIAWSKATFGPGDRTLGVVDHIKKELKEVKKNPEDVTEWIDLIILAIDGAWRNGHSPTEIIQAYHDKMAVNRARKWPDWREAPANSAIEHIREA